jgi:ABC-type amino acid transport substrate-binding protein
MHVDRNTLMPAEQRELRWLQKVLAEAQCPLHIIDSAAATTKRRLNDLREGHADIWFGASYTPSREQYLHFSVPYYQDEVRRYVRTGELQRCNAIDLQLLLESGCRIVGPLTGWFGETFDKFRERNKHDKRLMFYRHHVIEALRMLQVKRADLVITTKRQMTEIDSELARQFEYQAPLLTIDPLHFVFSKKTVSHAEFVKIDTVIRAALPTLSSP